MHCSRESSPQRRFSIIGWHASRSIDLSWQCHFCHLWHWQPPAPLLYSSELKLLWYSTNYFRIYDSCCVCGASPPTVSYELNHPPMLVQCGSMQCNTIQYISRYRQYSRARALHAGELSSESSFPPLHTVVTHIHSTYLLSLLWVIK
jgi:hypothetical protein